MRSNNSKIDGIVESERQNRDHRCHMNPERDRQTDHRSWGGYVLAVKKNQGKLFQEMKLVFETDRKQDFKGAPYDYAETVNKRLEQIETG